MKTKLAIVAAVLIVLGFGMVHSHSSIMEYVSIGFIGLGTSYLIYLLLSTRSKEVNNKPESPGKEK